MMRDYGFDFYWQDKYCNNLLAQGFEYIKDSSEYDAVTAFEVLEHVTNPVEFIKNAMLETGTDTIIFSTLLYEGPPPNPNDWWYYAFQTGQHIGFFQKKTLKIIGEKLRLNFYSANKIHILSRKKISETLLKISTNDGYSRIFSKLIQFYLGSRTEKDQVIILKKW
jgi:2-polyprenyl-3-methyl-5-hydroxy-6-metoxy-1,4-benzoquinol methylase